MLDPELIKKIKHIQIRAGHLATEALAGEYCSAFKGQGMEFDEVSAYTPGDDVRAIDWNVTARMDQPFIKRFREEREMTIMLAVDVSPSQGFGSTGRDKREVTAEFAAVIAFLAVANSDKVGLVLFSDHVEKYIPPTKGRAPVWQIIKEVLTFVGTGQGTAIDSALNHLMLVNKRRSLVFLLSDFMADGYQKLTKTVARRHDLVFVNVYDPREAELVSVGLVELRDSETGETLLLDTSSQAVRNHFAQQQQQLQEALASFCRKQGIDLVRFATDGDLVTALLHFLKNRERRKIR